MTPGASLGRLLVLTDRTQTGGRPLVDVVAAALAGGARTVLFREKDLPRAERVALGADLAALVRGAGGTFLVSSDPTLDADGVHFAALDEVPGRDDRPAIVGGSCHSLPDVLTAIECGFHYVTISPIFETVSKPGYGPALGLQGLRDLVDEVEEVSTPLPVYALGGIDASVADACRRAGASGVAVMGEIMRAPDPAATVAQLLAALGAPAAPTPTAPSPTAPSPTAPSPAPTTPKLRRSASSDDAGARNFDRAEASGRPVVDVDLDGWSA